MSSHQIVTLDKQSRSRVLFAGNKLVRVDMPPGARVIYPKKPLAGLPNVDAAIRYALHHPENSEPLYAKLRPGMNVVIAIDDLSMPLPPMRKPDVRERVLEIVLQILSDHGVNDVHLIMATALHRRMKPHEIRHVVGDRIFKAYYPHHLENHDAEDPKGLKEIGVTSLGEVVEINRKAAESDLLIYVNLNFVPMNGGHKSAAVGLAGYRSLKAHHNPHTLRRCDSYMDPERSALSSSFERMGSLLNQALNVFTIETTINNRMFDTSLSFLAKNEDELTPVEEWAQKALVKTLEKLPSNARQALFDRVPSPFEVTGVWAGETEAVHKKTLKRSFEQYLIPVEGQADTLVLGIPYISPYNVHAFLNPLLVSVMAEGYLFSLYRGAPLVRKGGTLIITHPCSDTFDTEQHVSYIEFVHHILPQTRDAMKLHKEFEASFAQNVSYIQAYRSGHAYHPAHPFFMWYWGEPGRQHLGRVIVVGADNSYIPKLFGYETARSMPEALEMAKSYHVEQMGGREMQITLAHLPPIFMADVSSNHANLA